MSQFVKTYRVEPNKNQRESLSRAFKILVEYFLNEENRNVEVIVDKFDENRISADLIVDGKIFDSKIIGVRGGIITI